MKQVCHGTESLDPHIIADPDPGSQNVADLYSKHCMKTIKKTLSITITAFPAIPDFRRRPFFSQRMVREFGVRKLDQGLHLADKFV